MDSMLVTHQGTARWTHDEVVSSLKLTHTQYNSWFRKYFVVPLLGLSLLAVAFRAVSEPTPMKVAVAVALPVLGFWIWFIQRRLQTQAARRLLKSGRPNLHIALRRDAILVATPSTSSAHHGNSAHRWNGVASWRQHGSVISIETDTGPLLIPTSALDDDLVSELRSHLTAATNLGAVPISPGSKLGEPGIGIGVPEFVDYEYDRSLVDRSNELIDRTSAVPDRSVGWPTHAINAVVVAVAIVLALRMALPVPLVVAIPIAVLQFLLALYQSRHATVKHLDSVVPADPRTRLRLESAGCSIQWRNHGHATTINWARCTRWVDGGDLIVLEDEGQWHPLPVGTFPEPVAAEIRFGLGGSLAEQFLPQSSDYQPLIS